jgi:prepilin-type N-terminal cleavage/methylation domain-containing protein
MILEIFKKLNTAKDNKGFTLIEVMISIFIITQAVVALISLSTSSFFITKYANNEIIVNNLLQETLDYIRNDRDSIAFQKSNTLGWDSFKDKYDPCFSEEGCYINTIDDIISACESTCPYFYYDKDAEKGRFYHYYTEFGVKTSFSNQIKMSLASEDVVNVSSVLRWKNGNLEKVRILSTSLSNWLQ